jgi:hypothetical protein
MRTVRSVVRALGALIAVFLAVAGPVRVAPAAQASVREIQQHSARTAAAGADPRGLAISISGLTPDTATPNSTVTLHGTVANHTGATVSGIAVQAQTSTVLFNGRAEMTSFADTGAYPYLIQPAGTPQVTDSVPNGVTVRWAVSFPAEVFYDQFGVFPIQVQASVAGTQYTAAARTFLPFWPEGDAAIQPKQLQVAWVWPLIDTPQQGACPQTLATSRLAGSVAPGGRLSTLLDAGVTWAQADHLTWDIDPALLADVSVMTRPYHTAGDAACSDRFPEPSDAAARKWLAELGTSTAGEPAFLTPYADVDVAALSHAGLDASLRSAYQVGDSVAGQILPGTFGVKGTGSGDGAILQAAWPADGIADAGVLTSLANDGGISTVVLNSGELPSPPPEYDNALSRTTSGIGTSMSVLLADSGITSLLGSASPSATAAGQFAFTQDFLAQTAMIASEAPNAQRSLVVAPPPDWDPSPAEAAALLSMTHAPWLRSAGLSTLAAEAAKLPSAQFPAQQMSRDELSARYLDQVKATDASLSLFKNLLYQPPASLINSLEAAVAATESSAWRGSAWRGGALAVKHLSTYLSDAEHKVQIIASKKILLTGTSGETPVSVQNSLVGAGMTIQVRVTASTPPGSQLQVGPFAALLKVLPGKTNTIRMPVHSATIGTTAVQLELVTQNGTPLTWTAQPLSVEVTRFGRSLLIIIGGALGILVLTSAFRLRRKRKARAEHDDTADETVNAGGAG